MGNEPHGIGAGRAEQGELDALRERAYGPRADIADDPDAVARLEQLEAESHADGMPVGRLFDAVIGVPTPTGAPSGSAGEPDAAEPGPAIELDAASGPATVPRVPRWHTALVGITAVAALLLGAAVFSESRRADEVAEAPSVVVGDRNWATSSESGYELFLDLLRDTLLAGPGMETISERIVRDDLRPYGSIYGRMVWAGSTSDGEYCMVLVDLPEPAIGCISMDDESAIPLSIVLPARADPDAGLIRLGEPVTYTLLPGGSVVATPAPAPVGAP